MFGFVKPKHWQDGVDRAMLLFLGTCISTFGIFLIFSALCGAALIPADYSPLTDFYSAKQAVVVLLIGQAGALLGVYALWLGWRGE